MLAATRRDDDAARRPRGTLWALGAARCEQSRAFGLLRDEFGARFARPCGGAAGAAACAARDFRFLFGARRVLLSAGSTFAFWPAFLAGAVPAEDGADALDARGARGAPPPRVVHVPLRGEMDDGFVVPGDGRYVYHDVMRERWFGRHDGRAGRIAWNCSTAESALARGRPGVLPPALRAEADEPAHLDGTAARRVVIPACLDVNAGGDS